MDEDKTAQQVLERWRRADRVLSEDRRNYWLNYAFYTGNQWIWWDPIRNIVQNALPSTAYETDRVRITINKIQERVNQLIGRFTDKPLVFEPLPSSADDATLSGAKLAQYVLEATKLECGWEAIRRENIFNTLMGGTSAVVIEWDGSQGEQLMINQTNQDVIGTGEVTLSPLSIAEFSVTPGSRRWQDAPWWVGCTAVPPEQAQEHYNLPKKPEADAGGAYSPLQRSMMESRGIDVDSELTAVYVMYERPNKKQQNGKRAVVINGKTVFEGEWNLPDNKLNIEVFRQQSVPMRWTGTTICTAARAPQISYNAVFSTIIEHAKLAGNTRLLVPFGSLSEDTNLTDEPGEIVNYYAVDGQKPDWMQSPDLPRWLTNLPDILESQLDGILHTHAVSRGEAPGDRNSGLALSILAEKNDTPLGPMARDQAEGWGNLGTKVLDLYSSKAIELRKKVVFTENGVPIPFEWNKDRLHGQTRVTVPLDATVPQSKTATQALLTNLAQSFPGFGSMIDNDKLIRMLDLPSSKMLSEVLDHNIRRAQKENDLMSVGEVVIPETWEDHAKHMAEHNRFRNTDTYRYAGQEIRQMVDAHIDAHQRLVEEEAVRQAELNAIQPGFGALPQADEPIGSAVPIDQATMQGMVQP